MSTGNKIILRNISKTYNKKRVLNIQKAEIPLEGIITIMGWSGSGKSTFLNILNLIDYPDNNIEGKQPEIIYKFSDSTYTITFPIRNKTQNNLRKYIPFKTSKPTITKQDNKSKEVQKISINTFRQECFGLIFQEHYLHPSLNILNNIRTPLFISSKTIDGKKNNALKNACKTLTIDEELFKHSDEVSGGQAQRTAILRGFLKESRIVFGDELTNNIDVPKSRIILHEIQKALNKKSLLCFIWVSHDIFLINEFADTIITIDSNGDIKQFYRKNKNENPENLLKLLDGQNNIDSPNNKTSLNEEESVLRFRETNATWKDIFLYRLNYAIGDLFKKKQFSRWPKYRFLMPTNDFIIIFLSLVVITFFILSMEKIGSGFYKAQESTLSDPRMNSLVVTPNGKLDYLNDKHLTEIKEYLSASNLSIRYITPVYEVNISLQNSNTKNFCHIGNALTFRPGDPIVQEVIGKNTASFIDDLKNWKGLIIREDVAKEHGCNNGCNTIIANFNNLNTEPLPILKVNTPLPFRKKILIREEFFINTYKYNNSEPYPFMSYISIYPKSVNDTQKIIDKIKDIDHYEIRDEFSVTAKLKRLEHIKTQFDRFKLISFMALSIISTSFIIIALYNNLNRKRREIGVFLSYGMTKWNFMVFYFYETCILLILSGVVAHVCFICFEKISLNKKIEQWLQPESIKGFMDIIPIDPNSLNLSIIFLVKTYTFEFIVLLCLQLIGILAITSKRPIKLLRGY